jgi:chromosome segregation ATPase
MSLSSSCRPVPQTSTGRLVSLTVDNPKQYISSSYNQEDQTMPALVPTACASITENHDAEEKTMLWKNIATLFMKSEQTEDNMQSNIANLTRGSDEMYQELQELRTELTQVHDKLNDSNLLSDRVRKLRKYVNKKCEKVRSDVTYGAYSANDEVFAYVNKIRDEFDAKMKTLEQENTKLKREMADLHETYDSDYEMFVRRENDLMEKLNQAVQTSDNLSKRLVDLEEICFKQIQEARNFTEQYCYHMSGDLREEFARAISKEVEFESKASAQQVQNMNEELIELITRSNQYHSHRYFGTVEDIKQIRENAETLKKSIGMVDAELSDTKETVEFLKDEVGQASNDVYDLKEEMSEWKDIVYRELDRDYYDLKDYVRHRIHRHKKQDHNYDSPAATTGTQNTFTGIDMIVTEYPDPDVTEQAQEAQTQQQQVEVPESTVASQRVTPVVHAVAHEDQNVIIIDADTVVSDDEDEQPVTHT